MNKTGLIQVRVSPADKALIEAKAAACRLSTSAFLRQLAAAHEPQSAWDQAAVAQLKRIGRNLNQFVRLLHQGDFSAETKDHLRRCLKALQLALGEPE